MKLRDFLNDLNRIANINPEALDLDVIYAMDDEGNGFNLVFCNPTIGEYDGEYCGEFNGESEINNAICIN